MASSFSLGEPLRNEFVLTEYRRVWEDVLRSAAAIETWARYFILIVGGYIAIAGAIAGGLGGAGSPISSAGLQGLGVGAIPLGLVGFATCIYIAHERGSRIEMLKHLASVRVYLKAHDMVLKGLPDFPEVAFRPRLNSGDVARFSAVALLSFFILPLAIYFIVDGAAIVNSINPPKGNGALPQPPVWLGTLAAASLVLHYSAAFFVVNGWEKRYEKGRSGPSGKAEASE